MNLRRILVVEGAAKTIGDIPHEVAEAASALGYLEGLQRVVGEYKPAAAKRQPVDGVNTSDESMTAFRLFAAAMIEGSRSATFATVRALYLHDAASGMAKQNGNQPDLQVRLNRSALGILEEVPSNERVDDWWTVYEKVYVGLSEAGHIAFDETTYRAVLNSMASNGSKDTAGRRAFLAEWLVGQGRSVEAVEVLNPVEADTCSAPNQVERARGLLVKLRGSTVAPPVVPPQPQVVRRGRGSSRERRLAHRKKGGGTTEGGDGSDEPHPLIRHHVWYNVVGGTFIRTRRDNVVAPTHDYSKRASNRWCFFVCFFCLKMVYCSYYEKTFNFRV